MTALSKADYNAVFRYLKIQSPTSDDYALVDSSFNELTALSSPSSIVKVCSVATKEGFLYMPELDMTLRSNDIKKYFRNPQKIAILASTLGVAVDKKIKYYSSANILKAMFLDAIASVVIENVVDDIELDIRNQYPEYAVCMRYSCGYGDLPLDMQSEIISKLNATKLVGISVNSQNLMSPQKSITAFLGLSKDDSPQTDICESCNLKGKCITKCRRASQNAK